MNANGILRNGRELSSREVDYAKKLENRGLCTIDCFDYVNCVDTEDDDYDQLRDHDCKTRIVVENGDNKTRCPDCHRTIYLSEKKIKTSHRIRLDPESLRIFVRDLCSEITDDGATKRSTPLNYLGGEFKQVNVAEFDEEEFQIVIAMRPIEEEILATARIVDNNVLWVLADEALAIKDIIDNLGLHSITIGELVADEAENKLKYQIESTVKKTRQQFIDIAARKAINLCSNRAILERMDWEEFEHCVQTLLEASLGTSYLFGAVERGSGEPDGALTLHWEDESLFMWDAKFVNLERNDETELRGEYDKIFRHLKRMDGQERFQRDFDGVAGILLFTPGIKDANVKRLAETIHEREITSPKQWDGSIVYFELDALIELASAVLANQADVRHKPNLFRKTLHANLTSPSKHQNDPEDVHSPDYNSLHMSTRDIQEVFEFIEEQGVEHTEFDREKYLKAAEYFRDV